MVMIHPTSTTVVTLPKCLRLSLKIQDSNSCELAFSRVRTSTMSSCRCCRQASLRCMKQFSKIHKLLWHFSWVADFRAQVQDQVECQLEDMLVTDKVVDREQSKLQQARWKQFKDFSLLASRRAVLHRHISLATKMRSLPPTFCLNQSPKKKNPSCRKVLQTHKA